MASSKVRGARFRDELRDSLKMLGCRRHCYDNVGQMAMKCPRCFQSLKGTASKRPADLEACYMGFSVVIEAKETKEPSIAFDRVETHQAAHLMKQEASGGIGLVLVRWSILRAPRAFAIPYSAWGLYPPDPGRKSLSLDDTQRPPSVIEVHRGRVRDNPGQGVPNDLVWDLRPVLDSLIRQRLVSLQAARPDLFPMIVQTIMAMCLVVGWGQVA